MSDAKHVTKQCAIFHIQMQCIGIKGLKLETYAVKLL